MAYKGILVHTITEDDLGYHTRFRGKPCKECGHVVHAHALMNCGLGRVQPQDVGKQIWFHDNVYQVENNEQLATRLVV